MLPDSSQKPTEGTRLNPLGIIVALVVVAVIAVALRERTQPQHAPDAGERAATTAGLMRESANMEPAQPAPAVEPLSLAYVPRDALAVAAIRPAALAERESLSSLTTALASHGDLPQIFGLPVDRIEQMTVVLMLDVADSGPGEIWMNGARLNQSSKPAPDVAGLIFRLADAQDADKLLAAMQPDPVQKEYAGQAYFTGKTDKKWSCFRTEDRTVVASPNEEYLRRLIVAGPVGASRAKWVDAWENAAEADAALLVKCKPMGEILNAWLFGEIMSDPLAKAQYAVIAPLWQSTSTAVFAFGCDDELAVDLWVSPTDSNNEDQVRDGLAAALALGQNGLTYARKGLSQEPGPGGAMGLSLVDSLDALLDSVKIKLKYGDVIASAAVPVDGPVEIITRSWPAIAKARQDAEEEVRRVAARQAAESENEGEKKVNQQSDAEIPAAYRVPGFLRDSNGLVPPPTEPAPAPDTPLETKTPRRRTNQELAELVAHALRKAKLHQYEIDIDARDGVVTLSGVVGKQEAVLVAGEKTAQVEGVTRVDNRLRVRDAQKKGTSAVGLQQDCPDLFTGTLLLDDEDCDGAEEESKLVPALAPKADSRQKATQTGFKSADLPGEPSSRSKIDSERQPKWEYKFDWINEHTESRLNALGEDGWELVAVNGDYYHFKRRK